MNSEQHQRDLADIASGQVAKWSKSARLYALIAPRAAKAVLLRRGPSNQVCLIDWDMKADKFTPGQWLKKRVYERRCDLSPDGRFFIYFAADYAAGFGSWTAISRAPYFTALSLWPKGDGWGGGGVFCENGRKIRLNHRPNPYHGSHSEMVLAKEFKSPPMAVVPLHEGSGCGEDDPIRYYRMLRDGWTLLKKGSESKWQGFSARYHFAQRKATIFEKRYKSPTGRKLWRLQMSSKYVGEMQGRWNVEEASIVDERGKSVLKIGRIDWCDLDHNGDILWAWAGKLWRLKYSRDPYSFKLRQPKLLGDFNNMVFENVEAPDDARKW